MYGGFKLRALHLNWHLFMHKVFGDQGETVRIMGLKEKMNICVNTTLIAW